MGIILKRKSAGRRFSKSLRFRIGGAFIGVILALLVLLNTYPAVVVQKNIVNSKKSDMYAKANMVSASLSNLSELTAETIFPVMEFLDMDKVGESYIVTDSDARIVYDNLKDKNLVGTYAILPEVISAMEGKDVFHCTYTAKAFNSKVSVPIVSNEKILGTVSFFQDDYQAATLLSETQKYIVNLSIVILAGAVSMTALYIYLFGKRMHLLLNGILRMNAGEYSYQIDMPGEDEVAEIAGAFNEMSKRLNRTEERRREFVSNASHELKTPLASIKLLSDSIIQTPTISREEISEFLKDIGGEIDRLTRITDHLMLLTKLDAVPITQFETVDIKAVIYRAIGMLQPIIEQNNIHVECTLADRCMVLAGHDGVYQIIFNLIENAIKYNVRNGFIQICLYRENNFVIVKIRDTGIGISEDDLPHIFERFYRVDKARSRETGGTGLGLSIVKQTMTTYKGEITAESKQGKGTTFTLKFLPANQPTFDGGAGQ